MAESKKMAKSAKPPAKRPVKRGETTASERVHMDLGEMVITTDNFEEIREQLVRSGRISGSRLTVRINGA